MGPVTYGAEGGNSVAFPGEKDCGGSLLLEDLTDHLYRDDVARKEPPRPSFLAVLQHLHDHG
ncbi:MAG: hypothetical protein M1118_04485 [Chloroflexi bacterium]|nr:hypothetical protein [Chloroflexota bacterium]